MTTTAHILVTTTTDSADEADALANSTVTARLAACAHVRDTTSTYWWEGAVQHDNEWEIAFKTRAELADALTAHILEHHSYETPQVIVTPITGGSDAYLAWIDEETRQR